MGKPIHEPDDPEFRARAVALVRSSRQTKAQMARDRGMNAETLRLWVKQAEIDASRCDGLTTDEKAELARLRREVAILKKVAAFFARESTTQ